jgi:hypothetical protein
MKLPNMFHFMLETNAGMKKMVRKSRGELPENMAAAYEKQHKAFEALQRSVASLAESLELQLPHLPETTTRMAGDAGAVSLVSRQVECHHVQHTVVCSVM